MDLPFCTYVSDSGRKMLVKYRYILFCMQLVASLKSNLILRKYNPVIGVGDK